MKKLLTIALTVLLGAGLVFAQSGFDGGGKPPTPPKPTKKASPKNTKVKKGQKGASGGATTQPPK